MANIFDMTEESLRQRRRAQQQAEDASNPPDLFGYVQDDARAGAILQGATDEQAAQQAITMAEDAVTETRQFLANGARPDFSRSDMMAQMANEREAQLVEAETQRQDITLGDMLGSAWQSTATQGIIDLIKRETPEADPDFDYTAHREELEAGLTQRDIDWLREDSVSLAHAQRMRQEALEAQEEIRTVFSQGTFAGFSAMLATGVADPVGLAAGLGVGKALQVAGVGSRALYQAGYTGRALGSLAAEGALANTAVEGILDASGRNVDANDYAMSAAFGALMNLGASPFVLRGAREVDSTAVKQELADMDEQYAVNRAELYTRAQQEAGPGASADDIARQARRIQQDDLMWYDRARLAGVPEQEQFIRSAEFRPVDTLRAEEDAAASRVGGRRDGLREAEDEAELAADARRGDTLRADEDAYEAGLRSRPVAAAEQDAGPTTVEDLEARPSRLSPEEEAAENLRYGTDQLAVENPGRARAVNHIYRNAEEFTTANPVDERRLNDLLGRMGRLTPYLASTGQNMMRSRNQVARMYSQTILENTTGAGGRRTSAALDKYMGERVYLREVEGFEAVFKNWRRRHGGSAVQDVLNQKSRARFNDELSQYRNRIERGERIDNVDADPDIRRASDMLDRAYQRTVQDQKYVRTPGHEALPDQTRGYYPHMLSPARVANMSNAQQRALAAELQRQMTDLFDNVDLARKVSARMVDRLRVEAAGGAMNPVSIRQGASRKTLTDAMRAEGVADTQLAQILRRMEEQGPAYTRSRMDLDLNATIRDPETGEEFPIRQLYESNHLKLFQQHAQRVAGEIALTKRGIYGREGLDLVRDAIVRGGPDAQRLSAQEQASVLRAFDQTASEMLTTPYGTMTNVARHEWANNLRILTSTARLGGMAITQLGESANVVPALGVTAALRSIRAMPRMIQELRHGRSNPMLESLELVGGEFGGEYKQVFPFVDADDIYVVSGEELNVVSRGIRSMGRAMTYANLWQHTAAAQTRGVAEQIMAKSLRAIRDGKDDIRLDDMGIDADLREAIRAQLDEVAQWDSNGNLVSVNAEALPAEVTHRWAQAVNRGAKQIIQGNFVGETGYWAHDDLLKLLFQFRTFSLTAMEKQWKRVAGTQGTAKAIGYLLGSMAFALPLHIARVQIAATGREDRDEYLDRRLSLWELGRATMNYSSLSGMASDVLNLFPAGLGVVDNIFGSSLRPESTEVRGRGGTLASTIPAVGLVEDAIDWAGDPLALSKAASVVPGGNIPWILPFLNSMEPEEDTGRDL